MKSVVLISLLGMVLFGCRHTNERRESREVAQEQRDGETEL